MSQLTEYCAAALYMTRLKLNTKCSNKWNCYTCNYCYFFRFLVTGAFPHRSLQVEPGDLEVCGSTRTSLAGFPSLTRTFGISGARYLQAHWSCFDSTNSVKLLKEVKHDFERIRKNSLWVSEKIHLFVYRIISVWYAGVILPFLEYNFLLLQCDYVV